MTINWNTTVYAKERSILSVTGFSANAHSVKISAASPVSFEAQYIILLNGVVQVDMTDLIRIASSGTFTVAECDGAGDIIGTAVSKSWSVAGLMDPTSVVVPTSPLRNDDQMTLLIMPPSVMLEPISNAAQVQFEMYGLDGYDFATGKVKFLPSGSSEYFRTQIEVPDGSSLIEFWHLDDSSHYSLPLKELECGRHYVMVEWVSYTGRIRRHTFEAVKITTETTDQAEIELITNEYDVRKNRRDSLTLKMEGLSKYDYWYYADLITSSDVKLTLDGRDWYKVQVTSKKQTLPESDMGKFNTLEIPVYYRRYEIL